MTHSPESKDVKTTLHFDGKPSSVLMRIPCSCGWRGSWFVGFDAAQRSYERHIANVVCGPVPVSA